MKETLELYIRPQKDPTIFLLDTCFALNKGFPAQFAQLIGKTNLVVHYMVLQELLWNARPENVNREVADQARKAIDLIRKNRDKLQIIPRPDGGDSFLQATKQQAQPVADQYLVNVVNTNIHRYNFVLLSRDTNLCTSLLLKDRFSYVKDRKNVYALRLDKQGTLRCVYPSGDSSEGMPYPGAVPVAVNEISIPVTRHTASPYREGSILNTAKHGVVVLGTLFDASKEIFTVRNRQVLAVLPYKLSTGMGEKIETLYKMGRGLTPHQLPLLFPSGILVSPEDGCTPIGYTIENVDSMVSLQRLTADLFAKQDYTTLRKIALNLLFALRDAHRFGLVFGNLNPQNIFVDTNNSHVFLGNLHECQLGRYVAEPHFTVLGNTPHGLVDIAADSASAAQLAVQLLSFGRSKMDPGSLPESEEVKSLLHSAAIGEDVSLRQLVNALHLCKGSGWDSEPKYPNLQLKSVLSGFGNTVYL